MGLLLSLKTQTAERHTELEAQMDILGHFQTLDSYRQLIADFFTLYEPLEEKLAHAADWPQEGWNYDARRKTPWLKEDLHVLGLSPKDTAGLPRCNDLPSIHSLAAAVGSLYVLEGSTLGGQVITKLLGRTLHLTPQVGGRFFHGYGDQTGPMWRQFGEWAEGRAARAAGFEDAAVDAACATFDTFSRWFKP